MKKGVAISAFYRIVWKSFERLNQLMFWEKEKDIGKTTVNSWRLKMAPWRHTNLGGVRRIIKKNGAPPK